VTPLRRPGAAVVLALGLALALSTACSSTGGRRQAPEDVAAALESARADLSAGRTADALETLGAAREAEGLPLELRSELEVLLEEAANRRIDELAAQPGGAGELEDMLDLDLPGPIAVTAGVTAARKRLDAGQPYKAFRQLQRVEERYPTHHERRAAGELCVEAGLVMSRDKKRFLGFFSNRDEGIEALEWLVVTYPSEPRGDEAYFRLAELYAEDRDFILSVRRYEDLVAYHLRSPLAVEAQARIPRMRLAGLESPEYDRRDLIRARAELEAWLERYPGHGLEERVRLDYGDCLRRLVLSDLGIARFYLRIDRPYGARLHAARALETARLAGDGGLEQESGALVARADTLERELGSGAGREGFLDRPDAELAPSGALETPMVREEQGGGS
jgi:outer membrane protein assembly factor BamD (BamD/ComL family)